MNYKGKGKSKGSFMDDYVKFTKWTPAAKYKINYFDWAIENKKKGAFLKQEKATFTEETMNKSKKYK